jgi:hypothetical protein
LRLYKKYSQQQCREYFFKNYFLIAQGVGYSGDIPKNGGFPQVKDTGRGYNVEKRGYGGG